MNTPTVNNADEGKCHSQIRTILIHGKDQIETMTLAPSSSTRLNTLHKTNTPDVQHSSEIFLNLLLNKACRCCRIVQSFITKPSQLINPSRTLFMGHSRQHFLTDRSVCKCIVWQLQ